MSHSLIAVAAVLALTGGQGRNTSQESGSVRQESRSESVSAARSVRGLVAAQVRVDVPAQVAGQLTALEAREGLTVQAGMMLADIDEFRQERDRRIASVRQSIAASQAANDIDARYWQAAAELAEDDYVRAVRINKKLPGAVPQTEERRRFLTLRRCLLESEKVERDRRLAALTEQVKGAEAELTVVKLRQHRINAPSDGLVTEILRRPGEWVEPGDTVLRIVRLSRLRVECLLSAVDYSPHELAGRRVTVTAQLPRGRREGFAGHVVFVNPVVEPGGEFRVWAEIENRVGRTHWLLRPGMEVVIDFEPSPSTQPTPLLARPETDATR